MSKPKLLDLFSGAGGAGMGYHRAGFDVVGVDNRPMPRYPFEFHQADALKYLAEHGSEFDIIHASPPCQDHSPLSALVGTHGTGWLLPAMQDVLRELRKPFVIENVAAAVMPATVGWAAGMNVSVTGDIGSTIGGPALGIDWMTGNELSQAIPPAYTEFLGTQLLEALVAA